MKSLKMAVLSLAVAAGAANATSLHPDTFRNEVAPVLHQLKFASVGTRGEVVKTFGQRPFTTFKIAIPVTVDTGSACTSFVGQQTNVDAAGTQTVRVIGGNDPVNDVCIAVMPMPIPTKITVDMKVLTGGFVPAQSIQQMTIDLAGKGLHVVRLDMGNNSVTVRPLVRMHR